MYNNRLLYIPILIFAFISLIIVIIWFKSGLYFGGAEVGISPYYNPARFLNIQKYIWWGDVAPGMLVPMFISGVPLYFVLSIIASFVSPLFIQVILFFGLLFLMGYGMYLFSLGVIGKEKYNYAIMAGVFYMFNSYTMVEVWHRFLYTGFFLTASLPILAIFWKKWITEESFISLGLFLLTNLVFVYMFGNLTSVITIWILLLFITSAHIIFPWIGKKIFLKVLYRFILGFLLFIGTNLWWLLPVFSVSTGILPEQHSNEENIFTIANISKQTVLPFTLQLANPYYLFSTHELGVIYSNLLFLLLPWIPAAIIFIGLLSSFKKKLLAGLSIFFLVSILLVKGAAGPFGYPYIWGFMNIYSLAILRNPFEKLGVLLIFLASFIFAIGLEAISSWTREKIGSLFSKFIYIGIMISILIYAFPMFTGGVFNNPNYPFRVNIPKYYNDADNWFRLQNGASGNILHLPFPSRDVVTYNWENGYHGVEINEVLFTSLPSLTRNVGIKRVDDTLKSLSFIFGKPYSDDKNQILKILRSLNVQYIVLHKDTRWEDTSTYGKDTKLNNPSKIEDTLNNLEFIEKSAMFGDLEIFKLKDQFYQPKITFSDKIDLFFPGESNILQSLFFTTKNNQITPLDQNFDTSLLKNSSQIIIFPESILYNWEGSKDVLNNILSQIVKNPQENSSPFYQINKAEKYFSQTGELLSQILTNKIISANNSLIDFIKRKNSGDNNSAESILNDYSNQIDSIFTKDFSGSSLQKQFTPLIERVFILHLYALENLSPKVNDKLKKYLVSNNVLPNYLLNKEEINSEVERRVQRFSIPIDSRYELIMTNANTLKLYPDVLPKLNILLDGKKISVQVSENNNNINLGETELKKGIHEISYNVVPSVNLAPSLDKFTSEGTSKISDNQIILDANGQTGGAFKFPIQGVSGGDVYQVSFEGLFENPREFYLQVVENTQSEDNPHDCSKISCYPMNPGLQTTQWQNYFLTLNPLSLASTDANFQIILPTINTSANYSSSLEIRNIKIYRVMDNNLVLKKNVTDQLESTPSAKLVEFKKNSSVEYEGKFILEKPNFIFFKETFSPGWELSLISNGHHLYPSNHYLANLYSNSWFIANPGNYEFKLEFKPQGKVMQGFYISILSWFIVFSLIVGIKLKRRSIR